MTTFYDAHCNIHSTSLPEDESRHAIKALRIRLKEAFDVINGAGLILHCHMTASGKNSLDYHIDSHEFREALKPHLHLAVSPLKQADRFEFFIEKATELGVNEITPILCSRTEKGSIKEERLIRIMISAIKQSGNPYLPVLNSPRKFEDLVRESSCSVKLFGHCLESRKKNLSEIEFKEDTLMAIGPEGDFDPKEIELALNNNFIPIALGTTTLRTETAALTACAYFQLKR